jgi:SecD/SecF fusion protein
LTKLLHRRWTCFGLFSPKDTATVNGYLKEKLEICQQTALCEILWGKLTIIKAKDKDVEAVELYAIKGNRDNEPAMSGGVVTDAKIHRSVRKTSCFDANERARSKGWEELTGRAYTQKSTIVLDNIVYSAPGVSSGPIWG